MTTRDNYCFIHSCHLQDRGTTCLEMLLERIKDLPLKTIFVNNLGIPIDESIVKKYNNVILTNYSSDIHLFETPTINKLREFSIENPGNNLLYIHTKGVTQPIDRQGVTDWTQMMLHFLIDPKCIDLLNEYKTLGCNLRGHPTTHYSGNFWWATTSYLSSLPICNSGKFDSEFWVQPVDNSLCLHESGIDHYYCDYPKERYL
jgi:hypothetical protein